MQAILRGHTESDRGLAGTSTLRHKNAWQCCRQGHNQRHFRQQGQLPRQENVTFDSYFPEYAVYPNRPHTHPLEQRHYNAVISLPYIFSSVRQLTSCDMSVRLSVAARDVQRKTYSNFLMIWTTFSEFFFPNQKKKAQADEGAMFEQSNRFSQNLVWTL